MMALKTALHLSAVPSSILCREMEQEKVIRFCKTAVLEQRPGSMYVCGRPGTGKSLIMEKVKILCTDWTKEVGTCKTVAATSKPDKRKTIYSAFLLMLAS
jgi:cell division control protein 6